MNVHEPLNCQVTLTNWIVRFIALALNCPPKHTSTLEFEYSNSIIRQSSDLFTPAVNFIFFGIRTLQQPWSKWIWPTEICQVLTTLPTPVRDLCICDRCVTQIGRSNIAWQAHLVLVLVKIIWLTNRSSGKARASPGKPSWLSVDYDPLPHCSTLHALFNTILLHMHSNIGRSDPAINVNTGPHRTPQCKLDVILPLCR